MLIFDETVGSQIIHVFTRDPSIIDVFNWEIHVKDELTGEMTIAPGAFGGLQTDGTTQFRFSMDAEEKHFYALSIYYSGSLMNRSMAYADINVLTNSQPYDPISGSFTTYSGSDFDNNGWNVYEHDGDEITLPPE